MKKLFLVFSKTALLNAVFVPYILRGTFFRMGAMKNYF